MQAYPRRAPNMKNMQANIQAEMAVIPSTFGEALFIELKILI